MRHAFGRGSVALLTLVAALGGGPVARSADPDVPAKPPAARAVERATPELPAAIVAAMQDGKYAEADKALAALASDLKTTAETKQYIQVIRGVALRLSGKLDAAREILSASLKAAPKGQWSAKLRSELAAVEIVSGKFAAAEALAREEAEGLLAGDRKDRLAEVYRGFADRLIKPDLPTIPPDYEGAYALLVQARSLAKGHALRASLLHAMAVVSQKAGNHGRAITDFQSYLNEYKNGADRNKVRYELAESQLGAGQALPARLTWTDLARDLEKVDTKEAADLRARSLYGIAKTHGIPAPPDDAQLGLGVAALKRMLASYPSHPLAVRASYEVASSYLARGKSQEALAAFMAFLKGDDALDRGLVTPERAELLMSAQFQIGQILQGQGKFDEAITAYKGYLAKYPNGPQSADAQRAVLDVQVQVAYDLVRREKYAEARAAFLAFAAQNPLDGRIPQLLFEVGQTYATEKKYEEAIAAWETLAGKFPGSEPAAHAQFSIAWIFENDKADPAAAIERYRKVAAVEPWHSQALQRVALMEAKSLSVVTERAFRTGETPRLKIATRNLEKLTFTAYKLDPETYFRKKHTVSGVEALDIGLVAPDAEWTADVPKYGKYKPIETSYELKKLEMPGVYVVKVSDEKALQATTLVLGSDLDAIVKTSREQLLVYVQDMKTGKGRAGARVLISDETGVILDAKAGADGVLLREWDAPLPPGQGAPVPEAIPAAAPQPVMPPCGPALEGQEAKAAAPEPKPHLPQGRLSYLVLDAGHAAGSGLDIPQKIAQGLSARAYLYTDRPAYRPGNDVELRGVVREVVDGQYANVPGATYWLEVYDSRGRKLVNRSLKLSEFGTFHEAITLDDGAPVGSYRIRLTQPGKSEFAGAFEVQAYQLEKIDLAFDLPRTVYYRGETIKGTVVARYQYGTPLANRAIAVQLPDGRTLSGQTDAAGKYAFELETTGFAEEQALRLVARLPQDNVAVAATVMLAVRAFRIDLNTSRDVYLDGEAIPLRVTTLDAQGEPTGQSLSVTVLKRVERNGQTSEREASREEVVTDKKTGKGAVRLKVEDEEGGSYVVRASGTDRFGNPVISERMLTISGKKDETKLRILTDRTTFKVGESAEVRLVNRGAAGTALLTWEADRILSYKIVPVKEGENLLSWDVDGKQFPNFTLAASRMAPPAFFEARLDVRVERDLRVTVTPKAPSVSPGGEVEVEVATTDQNGKPVAAELSVALVDRSLLRLFADKLPTIDQFFYDQTRTSSFASESSATFHYNPATVPVPEAVVEEAAQQAAQLADAARLGGVREAAEKNMAAGAAPAPAASPAPAPPGGPQGGGFGMGGGGMGRRPGAAGKAKLRAEGMKDAPKSEDASAEMDFAKKRDGAAADALEEKGANEQLDARRSDIQGLATRAMSLKAGGDRGVAPRERFVETAYWNPAVVTGRDGKATVKFTAPAALSDYRFTARGVSGAETLVGQATADLAVRKDFFVDLKAPAALTQGDKPRFAAEVHHKGVVGA
ncbi:MAG: large extracellular alpha-helical protein, partial [Planctomycetota bacterium]|nr:large extracellular alpha-helical protein [Planctomycetota bacterium]